MSPKCSAVSKRPTTPKRKTRNTSNVTPKKTPNKSRSPRSKALPKSPISDSLRQSKINEFFQPSRPPTVATMTSLDCPQTQPQTTRPQQDFEPKIPNQRKASKAMPLCPIFSPQKRMTLRNAYKSTKKLKIELKDKQNKNEIKVISINNSLNKRDEEMMDLSDNIKTQSLAANELPEVVEMEEQNTKKVINKSETHLNELMDELKINEKDIKKCNEFNEKYSENMENNPNLGVSDDFDDDLIPVFKRPEPIIKDSVNDLKENKGKYMDKEKEKKMNYILKNLSRLQKDREILSIQPIDEMEFPKVITTEEIIIKTQFVNPFKGIDLFREFIPKIIGKYLNEKTEFENPTQKSLDLFLLPLNRLIPLIPIVVKRLDESQRQSLLSHIIKLVSTEECLLIAHQIESKTIELFCENDFEIYLSVILRDFYQILNRISVNCEENQTKQQNDREINSLLYVLKIMTQVLDKCSLKIEGIDVNEELIQLLIIAFGLGVEYRLIGSDEMIMNLKEFIKVLIKRIFFDEKTELEIIEKLVSFYNSEDKQNTSLNIQIATLFPLEHNLELKRKFCISVINSFVPKITNDFKLDFTLNDIKNCLNRINWKKLTNEEMHAIIKLIGISLDLPNDLIDYKETIVQILNILSFEINTLVPKASDFEFSDIHKLQMILRTKVNVSTKRF